MVSEQELVIRLFISVIVGILIGYERKNRAKEAGIRTHVIVCLGACLIMIISKYGFLDLLNAEVVYDIDPTRVASQIVSGVGFLGAGMILVRKQTISGLTTAAGIWATSGIGMAIGTGMYLLGILSAGLIVGVQVFFRLAFTHPGGVGVRCIRFQVTSTDHIIDIKNEISKLKLEVLSFKIEREKKDTIIIETDILFPSGFSPLMLFNLLEKNDYITALYLDE